MHASVVTIPSRAVRSSHAEVTRCLAVDIVAGRLEAGQVLPRDADLIARFKVSRTVLRESVKTLVAKGLLTTKARVGTTVLERAAWNMFDPDVLAWHLDSGIDARFLADLAEIRLAVEPQAASLAAERRSERDLAQLRDSIGQMQHFAPHSEEFADADLALHLVIATASGNPFMRSVGAVIEAALRASFRLSAPTDAAERDLTIAEHTRILDAVTRRDREGASAAMAAVIRNGLRRHGYADALSPPETHRPAGPLAAPSRASSAA
ncbi:FadR/GntR family transcriptional regulator [Roseomonas elaeocarpi]|uniref:FadR/GntR family transcriptional regulator n=1 Tax=Roseomonas elaeocarpi TaxID=907779 RepID=A0ABV6JZQ8_9PROT